MTFCTGDETTVTDLNQALTAIRRLPELFGEPWNQWIVLIGPVGIILLVLSVISVSIIAYKCLQLLFGRFHGRKAVNRSLDLFNHPSQLLYLLELLNDD